MIQIVVEIESITLIQLNTFFNKQDNTLHYSSCYNDYLFDFKDKKKVAIHELEYQPYDFVLKGLNLVIFYFIYNFWI